MKTVNRYLVLFFCFFLLLACVKNNDTVDPTPKKPKKPKTETSFKSDYSYNLNVVYFIPSDVEPNADYEKRLSKILLAGQDFVQKWMRHWGYFDQKNPSRGKTFGLKRDLKNGLILIHTVKGKEKQSYYPYEGGGNKIRPEIEAYFKSKMIMPASEHYLVISAVNSNLGVQGSPSVSVPFYGLGMWCYALDYPGLKQEMLGVKGYAGEKATIYIGGMLHELGHGMNLPHVGSSKTEKESPNFGTTLMGPGNYSYGKNPTFFHKSSAAILNTCQLTHVNEGTFYIKAKAEPTVTDIKVEGGNMIVEGRYNPTPSPVTAVIFRHYKASEIFLGGSHGYSSIAFVEKPLAGNKFRAVMVIDELSHQDFDFKLGITLVLENGLAKYEQSATGENLLKNSKLHQYLNYRVKDGTIIPLGDAETKGVKKFKNKALHTSLSSYNEEPCCDIYKELMK